MAEAEIIPTLTSPPKHYMYEYMAKLISTENPLTIKHQTTVIAVEWRHGKKGTIGIVAVQNQDDDSWRAFIGVANEDHAQEDAIKEIVQWGHPLRKVEAGAFFGYLNQEKFDDT